MDNCDTSVGPIVQRLRWSCVSKSLQHWWPSQRVAVVHICFWMDSCNNRIGPVVQTVTLTVTHSNTYWKTDDTINRWHLSMAWFEWTSQPLQLIFIVQRLRWSCVSKSLQHWWPSQCVAVVHGLIWMDKPDTSIGPTVQRLRWFCVSKSLQHWWPNASQLSISCFEWTAATTQLVLLFKQ